MQTLLQKLITERMAEGKSYRDIEHECGVNNVSIAQYHKGAVPRGKNLAMLAKYFRISDFWLLVEPADQAVVTFKRPQEQITQRQRVNDGLFVLFSEQEQDEIIDIMMARLRKLRNPQPTLPDVDEKKSEH